MTDSRLPVRRYDDDEVGKLLQRATELQSRDPSSLGPVSGAGLSLQELEEIAGEAGIDPSYLRRAAAEMESVPREEGLGPRLAGDDLTLVRETVVPGELTTEGFERALVVIQRRTAEHGQPSLMGRTLTWQGETASKTRSMQVVITVRDGQTHIRAEERLHQWASGLFGGLIGGVGGGLGMGVGLAVGLEVLGSVLFAMAFPVGVIGLSYIAAREIYHPYVARRRRALAELVDDVALEVSGAVELPPQLPGEGEPGTLGGEEPPRLLP